MKQIRSGAASTPIYILGLGLPVRDTNASESALFFPALHAAQAHPLLKAADVLIAGKSVLAALPDLSVEKIAVGVDMEALYVRIRENRNAGKIQVILCSGDSLLYGLGSRLADILGPGSLYFVPGISSLQGAAACLGLPWERARMVSLHGRTDMLPLAHALLCRSPEHGFTCLLTDAEHTPATIAAWMLERGCDAYRMHVLEDLYLSPTGEAKASRISHLTLPQAQQGERKNALNPPEHMSGSQTVRRAIQRVIVLEPYGRPRAWPFGLDDAALRKENNLITKAPVRAAGLTALGIESHHTVWDLGAGTGAVSLEAARLAWQGQVFAVEQYPERLAHIHKNRHACGAANLEIIPGRLPECLNSLLDSSLSPDPEAAKCFQTVQDYPLPRPHRIFIGGGLGGTREQAEELLVRAWNALLPGGRLLAHCVLLDSLERARGVLSHLGAKLSVTCLQVSVSSALATDMRLEALNPVFLVLGEKAAFPQGHL